MNAATVLVVEDEDVVRKILVAVLSDIGHVVVEARDGEEAVSMLDKQRVDLVITDKNLPGISGLDVLREARNRQPQVELMMVTGYASYESAVEALRLGASEYLEKPFLDLAAIGARVQSVLDRQRVRQAAGTPVELAAALVSALEKSSNGTTTAALPIARQLADLLKA